MRDMDPSTKPPQISEMFQKFALAFKTKTIEFFAEEDEEDHHQHHHQQEQETTATNHSEDFQPLTLSEEELITNQKVVVIKPDFIAPTPRPVPHTLIPSIFATVSSFEVAYLQLQTAHSPFHPQNIETADRSAVSHLHKLSQIKKWYSTPTSNPTPNLSIGSNLEAQVQENQSLLRSLEILVNRLQSEIDSKDAQVLILKQKLKTSEEANSKLSKRFSNAKSLHSTNKLLSITVFDNVLRYVCKSCRRFTKILVELMKRVGWDVDSAANSVYNDVEYAKIGDSRYAFMSYVCIGMFQGFDAVGFALEESGSECSVSDTVDDRRKYSLRQFIEHASGDGIEILNNDPNGCFARFCEVKYQNLVHPTMECSLFKNLGQNELILNMWRSSVVFYQAFVDMASSVWMLHKLAFSFDPVIEIFQVERGVDYSMVFMENVTGKGVAPGKTRAKVAFTVIPGFKFGTTVIQSQVYLTGKQAC